MEKGRGPCDKPLPQLLSSALALVPRRKAKVERQLETDSTTSNLDQDQQDSGVPMCQSSSYIPASCNMSSCLGALYKRTEFEHAFQLKSATLGFAGQLGGWLHAASQCWPFVPGL